MSNAAPIVRGDLIHYSDKPLRSLVRTPQERTVERWSVHDKPRGLWVSVLGKDDWASWCRSESFRKTRRQSAARVHLKPKASVLRMSSEDELDAFTRDFGEVFEATSRYPRWAIDWARVASAYDGIIIAPYIWTRRLHDLTNWYYGWDCASGCIWNPKAVQKVECLRDGVGRAPRPTGSAAQAEHRDEQTPLPTRGSEP